MLVATSSLFLVASAFGILKDPVLGFTYANLSLLLLAIVSFSVGGRLDVRPTLYLLIVMAIDLLFRVYDAHLGDVGYTVNIGKMALFALIAQQLAAGDKGVRSLLVLVFGAGAMASEVFVLLYPEHRDELYSAQGLFTDFDGGDLYGFFYRPTGLIGDPNYFAVPLVLAAVAMFARGRYAWSCFWMCLVAATGSRAALLATFVPIVAQRLYGSRSQPLRLAGYLALTVTAYLVAAEFNEWLRGNTSDSNTERALLLKQGVDHVLSLSFLHSTYGQPMSLGIGGETLVVHNTYLQTAVTSALLAMYLVYRSGAGLIRSADRLVLAALIIEMLLLDISSFSSFLFVFFLFSEPSRRPLAPFQAISLDASGHVPRIAIKQRRGGENVIGTLQA